MIKVVKKERYGNYSCNGCGAKAVMTMQVTGIPFTTETDLCSDCAEKLQLKIRLALNNDFI